MILTTVNSGECVRVLAVNSGRRLKAHLAAMGLFPGAELEVINGNSRGPFIVSVDGRRLILGNGMVQKIIVV